MGCGVVTMRFETEWTEIYTGRAENKYTGLTSQPKTYPNYVSISGISPVIFIYFQR
jgi:hypothetical protein